VSEDRYRLDRRIATGGMGVVWRATDTLLDRQVAVKVLKPEYADDPTFRTRFESEARHAAALDHDNVASVFDFGELEPQDGSGAPRPFLVMELVPGEPLSTLLRAGEPMPPERAADLGAQAADALAAAHAIGVVHRDVKPGNLIVTPRGQVKITDFGIARAADGAALTQTGQVVGTPAYIAPEQAEGGTATPASDVYSLGVVLYECLAGTRPFRGDNPISTALAHLREPPPPLPERVPAHLRAVVETALEKDPARRFASMSDFAGALRGAPIVVPAALASSPAHPADQSAGQAPDHTRVLTAVGLGAAGRPARERHRPAWLPWAGAAFGLLLVVALVSLLGHDRTVPAAGAAAAQETPAAASPVAASGRPVVRVVADDYVGLPEAEARRRLEDRGLRTAVHRVDNTAGAKGGTVAAVDPTGRLHEGDRVTLQVWREAVVAQPKPPKAKPAHKPKHDGPGKHGPKPKGHKKKGH
jgi:serine/threonine-protein kinase